MFKYENCKNGKQYGNHYESISTHLRMLQAEAPTGSLLYESAYRASDNYCKECRKANTRRHRNQDKNISFENKPLSYPVITEVKDYVLRMLLIRHARQVVADSIRRKQEKEKLHALWEE